MENVQEKDRSPSKLDLLLHSDVFCVPLKNRFSPDRRWVACFGSPRSIEIWDLCEYMDDIIQDLKPSLSKVRTQSIHSVDKTMKQSICVAWCDDSKTVLISTNNTRMIWTCINDCDTETFQLKYATPSDLVPCFRSFWLGYCCIMIDINGKWSVYDHMAAIFQKNVEVRGFPSPLTLQSLKNVQMIPFNSERMIIVSNQKVFEVTILIDDIENVIHFETRQVEELSQCGKVVDWCVSFDNVSCQEITFFLIAEGKVMLPWDTSFLLEKQKPNESDVLGKHPQAGVMEMLMNIGLSVEDESKPSDALKEVDEIGDEKKDSSCAKVFELTIGLAGCDLRTRAIIHLNEMVLPVSIVSSHSRLWIGDGVSNFLVTLKRIGTSWQIDRPVMSSELSKIITCVSIPGSQKKRNDIILFEAAETKKTTTTTRKKGDSSEACVDGKLSEIPEIHVFKPRRTIVPSEQSVHIYTQMFSSLAEKAIDDRKGEVQLTDEDAKIDAKAVMKTLESVMSYLQSIDHRLMRLENKVDRLVNL